MQKKSKHKKPVPETRLSGGNISFKGGKRGKLTVGEARDLIYPQAERILRKFGGAQELARVLKAMYPDDHWNPSSIYRWTYPISAGGSGGEIPVRAIKKVIKAARMAGIVLTVDDLYPGIFNDVDEKNSTSAE